MTRSAADLLTKVKTKIVATLGPASEGPDQLAALVAAGADVFRLNMAHGDHAWHDAVLARVRALGESLHRPIAVLTDLGGPKIRLAPIDGGKLDCAPGDIVFFVTDASAASSPRHLRSTYPTLVEELRVGDLVLLSDGTVALRVEQKQPDAVRCRCVQPGEIRSGGGINLPGADLAVPALTPKDYDDLRWAVAHGVDFIGQSFVRRAADVRLLRDELARLGGRAHIVAKIEKPQAVEALDDIIRGADAIMVARGDLGVEIDLARIAVVQKQIIARCQQARVPVITATQMLESMRTSRMPTRAEATDVANAILDGSDALMLSAETAIGQYPVEAVAMMNRIAHETEPLIVPQFTLPAQPSAVTTDVPAVPAAIVEATSRVADQIRAKLVIVATHSGNTALALSKWRSRTPILGISDEPATTRRMCLYWGVTPLDAPRFENSVELMRHVTQWGRDHQVLETGDRVVLVASTQGTAAGHDMMVVHEVR
jgi:pyruvate kinase